jgi:hypothetical protein
MNKKDTKFIKKWDKAKKMGMTKFMIIIGGLWGILTPMLILVPQLKIHSFSETYFSIDFAIKISVFVIFGIFGFGLILWKIGENRYLKIKKD